MVKEEREKMIVDNIGLVHMAAHRFTGRGAEYEDLYQSGCIGLIKAVDNFDKEKGFAFSTYAVPMIIGEIKRVFREGGAVKVSRALKEKATAVQYEREKFLHRYMREPQLSELAKLTGYSTEELPEILNVLLPMVSLSHFGETQDEEMDLPYEENEAVCEKLELELQFQKLTSLEKQIVQFRYYEDKTQAQTAKLLGISQVQVSRKEKALLQKLRGNLS